VTVWFLDASVLLACEDIDDANHGAARHLLRGVEPIASLDLVYYEVLNVATRAWQDPLAADRLAARIGAVAEDGGLVRVDGSLVVSSAAVARAHDITVYDAAYVVAAGESGAELVSCDVRDLVSRGLARLPAEALLG
jgi:predicted nucleic acid-binding protein